MLIKIDSKKDFSEKGMIIFPVSGTVSLKEVKKKYPGADLCLKKRKIIGSEGEKLICSTGLKEDSVLMLLGVGKSINSDSIRKLARNIISVIKDLKLKTSVIDLAQDLKMNKVEIENFIDYLYLNAYNFKKYISSKDHFEPEVIRVLVNEKKEISSILKERTEVSSVVTAVRDLINEIPNVVTPEYLKLKAEDLTGRDNVSIEIYEGKKLEKEKLNGLLNVGKGSKNKPALVKISYTPKNYKKNIAVVGKGITYDSGGLNIKTGSYMSTMKSDMSGAATALGIIDLISHLEVPVKVTSFLPLAENMPGSGSYKPDDIIVFRNGKSVEIMNTDAEGRLVLADAIIMASEGRPDYIVELSTLTGSIVSALGNSIAGLFTHSNVLWKKLKKAGDDSGEYVWQMPMYRNYLKSIRSEISDLKNSDYGNASSIKAGLFLNEFSGKIPFAHLDIAGTAFLEKGSEYINVKGATGFGIRLLYNFIKSF